MPFLNRAGRGASVDIAAVLEPGTIEYIASIVAGGALVSIGRTRDSGALSFSVIIDGQAEKEYCRTAEEACEFLREVDAFLSAAPPPPPVSTRPRKGA